MEPKGRGKKTLGRNGLRERNNQVITPVENAAKKETGNKTLGRKWIEGKEQSGDYSSGRCSEKGRAKKTIGSNGLRERNNQVLTPTEDAVKRKKREENCWKRWKGEQGAITCSLQWKMQLTGSGEKTLGRNGMKILGRG
jgi:hypothetical protein